MESKASSVILVSGLQCQVHEEQENVGLVDKSSSYIYILWTGNCDIQWGEKSKPSGIKFEKEFWENDSPKAKQYIDKKTFFLSKLRGEVGGKRRLECFSYL